MHGRFHYKYSYNINSERNYNELVRSYCYVQRDEKPNNNSLNILML